MNGDERDEEWERQHLYALFYGEMDLCGCGNPENAYGLIRDILDLAPFHQGTWTDVEALIGHPGAGHIVLNVLDNAGLIEHGGTIWGSWLTDKGRYARWLMRRHEWDDGSSGRSGVDDSGFPHDGAPCTPQCWVAPAGLDLSDPEPETPRKGLLETLREQAERDRAAQSPQQRAAGEMLENMLLYGQHPAPPMPDRPVGRVDYDGMLAEVARIGFGRPLAVGDFPELEQQRVRVLDTLDIPPSLRAEWARIDRESVRRFLPERAECRRYDSGTWVHSSTGHTCPKSARG